jgi:hypothetical protein
LGETNSPPITTVGYASTATLGKINSRLLHFLRENNILSKCQIGFLTNYSTTGHIFTPHTLIDKQINQNKSKVFSCFVDFKKAFDSIWHEGLLYKLWESGVGGENHIIKSLHTNKTSN